MTINYKKNGGGYLSGCYISFGAEEMKNLKIIDKNGNLKEIESAENEEGNTLIIHFKKN